MNKDGFKLGDQIADTITGFKGIAIASTAWLNGCLRVTIQPQELKDGKPIEAQTFDVEQLELLTSCDRKEPAPHGGDRPNIARAADPVR